MKKSFMAPDEFLILLDPQPSWFFNAPYYPTLKDKVVLRDAGIQTSYGGLEWMDSEPARGEYDFSHFEKMMAMNREAGMKTRVNVPFRVPSWMPDEWLLRNQDGRAQIRGDAIPVRHISFWNEEAQEYCDNYLKLVVDQYHAPDVMFNYGESQAGEGVLPMEPFYYDEFAIADYKKRLGSDAYPDISTQETKDWLRDAAIKRGIRVHKIINRHNEIWNELQPLMGEWSEHTANYAQKDIMRAYKKTFPDSHLVIEQCTFWDSAHTAEHRKPIDELKEELPCDVIVEAMWPQGLPITTPKSIARGYRGQIVGPSHPHHMGLTSLESWVVDNIKESHRQWLESSQ